MVWQGGVFGVVIEAVVEFEGEALIVVPHHLQHLLLRQGSDAVLVTIAIQGRSEVAYY